MLTLVAWKVGFILKMDICTLSERGFEIVQSKDLNKTRMSIEVFNSPRDILQSRPDAICICIQGQRCIKTRDARRHFHIIEQKDTILPI